MKKYVTMTYISFGQRSHQYDSLSHSMVVIHQYYYTLHWLIITKYNVHISVVKIQGKFSGPWNIRHSDLYLFLGQTLVGWLCWGLTSQSTIFQSCRDGAIASWVINQYFPGVKCLAQGHNTAEVGLEPRTSRSGVRYSTTEPPCSPLNIGSYWLIIPKYAVNISNSFQDIRQHH